MKQEMIQAFAMKNSGMFDAADLAVIQEKLANLDDSSVPVIMGIEFKNPTTITLIAVFLGWERFFLDDIGLGVAKLLTCYGFGIWGFIDMFTAGKRARRYNFKKFNEALCLCR